MIKAAKDVSSTKNLATKLEAEQMQYWITTRKDPEEVFRLLGPVRGRREILKHPQFTVWVKYVDDLNAEDPKKTVSMVPTLTKYFADETLLRITDAAKTAEKNKSIATKLETELTRFWLNSEKTPDTVLVDIGLHTATRDVLDNQLISFWMKYVDAYNVKYPGKKTTAIEAFTRKFGNESVVRMIAETKTAATTKSIATDLEAAQLKMWWSDGKSVDDVFDLLNLRRTEQDFSQNPLLYTWVSYMNIFSTENPSKTTALLSSLGPRFNDRPLMQILGTTTKFSSMENIATKLQMVRAKDIFASKVSPREVFQLLALDTVGDDIFNNPLLKKWLDYVEIFNKENPTKQESWFLPIRVAYESKGLDEMIDKAMQNPSTEKVAKLVESARVQEWLERWGHPPKNTFHFLHLNKVGKKIQSSE